jgi:ABC-type iron transport system FetAB ATPase subunit
MGRRCPQGVAAGDRTAACAVRWRTGDVTGEAGHFRVPLVSYAGQSPRFFAGTIRDNLAWTRAT